MSENSIEGPTEKDLHSKFEADRAIEDGFKADGINLDGLPYNYRRFIISQTYPTLVHFNHFLSPSVIQEEYMPIDKSISRKEWIELVSERHLLEIGAMLDLTSIQIIGYKSSELRQMKSSDNPSQSIAPRLADNINQVFVETNKRRSIIWLNYDFIEDGYRTTVKNIQEGIMQAFIAITANKLQNTYIQNMDDQNYYFRHKLPSMDAMDVIRFANKSGAYSLSKLIGQSIIAKLNIASKIETQETEVVKQTEKYFDTSKYINDAIGDNNFIGLGDAFAKIIFEVLGDEISDLQSMENLIKFGKITEYLQSLMLTPSAVELLNQRLYENTGIQSIIANKLNQYNTK